MQPIWMVLPILQMYRSVILPLIKPAVATTAILAFQAAWTNVESLSTSILMMKAWKTLAFYLNTLADTNNNVAGQGILAAGVLIQFVPNLAIFLILRRELYEYHGSFRHQIRGQSMKKL